MATYAIGDLQGCYDEFCRLLETLKFDPAADTLWMCGDLVNRGGQSLAVLRLVHSFGDRAITVLGNHDLSLLAVAERDEAEQAKVNAELREVLFAPDRNQLLDWLRARPLLHVDRTLEFMLVHAGLNPRWSTDAAEAAAREVEQRLRGDGARRLLRAMFGNKPDLWSPRLQGIERLRAAIIVFTRMRYCDVRGRIAYQEKGAPGTQ
jgi:bis(5'-nucleosyl)-tetraphosphatase (symmetrical)